MRHFYRFGRLLFVLITAVMVSPFIGQRTLWSRRWRQRFYGKLAKGLGIKKIIIKGTPDLSAKLVVCNHVSYTDIPVLGAALPCHFVSKDDVEGWPIIGWIARQFGTVFISRKSYNVRSGLESLHTAMKHTALPIVLFPEGTTSDGCTILPFKSSYFEIPEPILIQPVSIDYSHVNGLPASRQFKKMMSWRGSVTLTQHLKWLTRLRSVFVTVTFHPSFLADQDRKTLAYRCAESVRQGFESP